MKITFLEDYRGRETAGMDRSKGETVDAPWAFAQELIKLGVAEEAAMGGQFNVPAEFKSPSQGDSETIVIVPARKGKGK